MRHTLVVAALLLAATTTLPVQSVAQPAPDSSRAAPGGRWVLGLRGGLMEMQGRFRETVGPSHGGFEGFIALRSASGFATGIRLGGTQLQKRSETANLDSGIDVDLNTTTDLVRLGLFGQYGPRLGLVRPYAEGLLGIHLLNTNTKIPDDSNRSDDTKTHKESVAPAAGVAVGIEIGLYDVPGRSVGLLLEGRHTYGGTAEYLFYSKEAGKFVERSSSTTTSELSVGVTVNY